MSHQVVGSFLDIHPYPHWIHWSCLKIRNPRIRHPTFPWTIAVLGCHFERQSRNYHLLETLKHFKTNNICGPFLSDRVISVLLFRNSIGCIWLFSPPVGLDSWTSRLKTWYEWCFIQMGIKLLIQWEWHRINIVTWYIQPRIWNDMKSYMTFGFVQNWGLYSNSWNTVHAVRSPGGCSSALGKLELNIQLSKERNTQHLPPLRLSFCMFLLESSSLPSGDETWAGKSTILSSMIFPAN